MAIKNLQRARPAPEPIFPARRRAHASPVSLAPGLAQRFALLPAYSHAADPVSSRARCTPVPHPLDSEFVSTMLGITGRRERIRTSGPCLPKAVLYQAELLSVAARGIARSARRFNPRRVPEKSRWGSISALRGRIRSLRREPDVPASSRKAVGARRAAVPYSQARSDGRKGGVHRGGASIRSS